ncbi:invasion associated locus B family protein [Pacificibacter sp. AS14]|uniref:invasion associated locus B family protein n=1 Tax=Pacificibacter sp. AS14 TaxID=3135785 RepID=UPI0031737FBE
MNFANTTAKTLCLSTVMSFGLCFTATAQDADPAPSEGAASIPGLSTGTPIDDTDGIGQPYTLEQHGDWNINCLKAPEGQADPCSMFQLLLDEKENPVAEISLFHFGNGGIEAAATVTVPLDTLLTEQLTLTVDGANGRRYPFAVCSPTGCQARFGLVEDDVALLKKGATATLTIVPYAAPDVKVPVSVSLTGFTAAYTRVTEINIAARAETQ